jgi:DNA-binding transcriptional ArsR family regulator
MVSSMTDSKRIEAKPVRREATPDEFKAMSHPLRLRILRLCLHDALTNRQLADRLGQNPATVLHHVRMLVDTGFLAAEAPRTGQRGALEKPYRATGKSWTLSTDRFPADQQREGALAVIDAFRAEVIDSGPERIMDWTRVGLRLDERSLTELRERLNDVVTDFVGRPDDPEGEPVGVFVAMHRRA